MGPKWAKTELFSFYKILSILFVGSNLKCKTLQLSVLLCKPHAWKNAASQTICQNALTSDQIAGVSYHEYL